MIEQTQQQRPQKSHGICAFIPALFGMLIAALFLSLIIEWVGLATFWKAEGANHAKQTMLTAFNWFSNNAQQSLIMKTPVQTLQVWIAKASEWLFVKTGFNTWSAANKSTVAMSLYRWLHTYAEASIYVLLTYIIRLTVIVLTSPIFILAAIVGVVDGLVQRDLRRFGVGRESAFKYHHAKKMITKTMFTAWTIFIVSPISIHPDLIFTPAAVFFGFIIAYTIANFKKYL